MSEPSFDSPAIPDDFEAGLREFSERLIACVTSPEMVEQVQAVLNSSSGSRLGEAADRLTPSALKRFGVDLPDFTRVSSRYFDEGIGDEVNFYDVQGSRDILQLLNSGDPEILDELGKTSPDLLALLVRHNKGPFPIGDRLNPRTPGETYGMCACVGGGPSWSVCVGGGV